MEDYTIGVPVERRKENKLEVCLKARSLCLYTLEITANEKVFTPRYRRQVTDTIERLAIAIHTNVWSANNIYVNCAEDLKERNRLQAESIRQCTLLLSLIDIAYSLFHLSSRRVEYWSGLVILTRNFIKKWRDSDKQRYKDVV